MTVKSQHIETGIDQETSLRENIFKLHQINVSTKLEINKQL